jgi:glutathione S-transferase
MIKLFYAPGTCALAPHIVLEWIGAPYELVKVKLGDPAYTQINPMGKVPAMIDGDSEVMTQAEALLRYLAQKYPAVRLGDNGTLQDRFQMNQWLAFLTGDVHPAFYPFFRPNRYTTYSNDDALKIPKEAAYQLIDTVFFYLDQHLTGKDYMVGDRRTIVDPYAFTMIRWGNLLPKPLSDYPQIYRFYQKLREDEGVQRAMQQQGIQ